MTSDDFYLALIKVEPSYNRISVQGQQIGLESKSMAVLNYLALRHPRVVSIDELLEQVWLGMVVSKQSVQRCICLLRKALHDLEPDTIFIKTFPKLGYKLEVEPSFASPEQTPFSSVSNLDATNRRAAVRRTKFSLMLGVGGLVACSSLPLTYVSYSAMQTFESPNIEVLNEYRHVFAVSAELGFNAYVDPELNSYKIRVRDRETQQDWSVFEFDGRELQNLQLAWRWQTHSLFAIFSDQQNMSQLMAFDLDLINQQVIARRLLLNDPYHTYRSLEQFDENFLLAARHPHQEFEPQFYLINIDTGRIIPFKSRAESAQDENAS
ncbi:hypothetical protein C2869_07660 [Saccharobesus litoralis]|uniref:OmpR/PhoB-type domain-containing protein n=2 Tax=Saccharobesus litoralis TaxID=2172099 RepID=A0A2S0VQ17_9ALTE|nr:hypothetical protein C2869_07660 [Saccharobesus litoralis]